MNNYPDELDYDAIPWRKYASKKPSFGVIKFCSLPDSIWIEFTEGKIYLYKINEWITAAEISEMKLKAERGDGLSGFISSHTSVRDNFAVRYEWRKNAYRKF